MREKRKREKREKIKVSGEHYNIFICHVKERNYFLNWLIIIKEVCVIFQIQRTCLQY